jgi:hypothetical protein
MANRGWRAVDGAADSDGHHSRSDTAHGKNRAGSDSTRQKPARTAMRSLETLEAMRFPVVHGLLARSVGYLENEFQKAAGLAMVFTQHPVLKAGAIALMLVVWVAALVSRLSLFGAERGHPTPADLVAMTIGALTATFADIARAPDRGCRTA